jgi:hypothetical protein
MKESWGWEVAFRVASVVLLLDALILTWRFSDLANEVTSLKWAVLNQGVWQQQHDQKCPCAKPHIAQVTQVNADGSFVARNNNGMVFVGAKQ